MMNTNDQAGRAVHLPDKRNDLYQCGYASLREDHLVPLSGGAPLDETSAGTGLGAIDRLGSAGCCRAAACP
jgi:hypothetical protein